MYNAELSSGMGSDYFVQVIFALLLVLAVIMLLSYLAKRFSLFSATYKGPIKVLSGISLGGKDRLLLVQVGQEQLLLGMSPGNIHKLHKLQQPLDPVSIATQRNGEQAQYKHSFASVFNSVSRT